MRGCIGIAGMAQIHGFLEMKTPGVHEACFWILSQQCLGMLA